MGTSGFIQRPHSPFLPFQVKELMKWERKCDLEIVSNLDVGEGVAVKVREGSCCYEGCGVQGVLLPSKGGALNGLQ